MTSEPKCIVCGCSHFVQGKIGYIEDGYANVIHTENMLVSCPLILTFCGECGEVVSMKVTAPKKFT
ncbi:hypothetical protein LS684_11000 [Cytobacillus spongiae]|uniref:hypothetical protein n=1 Tax=Cytobacillus spongiae TaxID=2901381 RepID=UPI001F3F4DD2|nr:hypothetical protein [Cytobacillus spongiae]UII54223.1 hypothetical protein LS684_11000 [Cytobacillus spongiae]